MALKSKEPERVEKAQPPQQRQPEKRATMTIADVGVSESEIRRYREHLYRVIKERDRLAEEKAELRKQQEEQMKKADEM